MTASTEPHEPDTEVLTPVPRRQRRRPPGWLLALGAGALVVGALLLTRDDEPAARPPDLTTPGGAAETFARAAAAGDVDGVLAATCLGDPGCAAKHGGDVTPEQIAAAKKTIAENVRDLGARFSHAEFTGARAGARSGTQEVDYRLPGMSAGERHYLIFVEYQDRWLYIATGGGPTN